jgi:hypothetical protein
MDRRDFYFGQLLSQAELDDAFDAAELADKNTVVDFLGQGFVITPSNPATAIENAVPNLGARVSQFKGYDESGRRISNERHSYQNGSDVGVPSPYVSIDLSTDHLGASTSVLFGGNERTVTVFVEFERDESDPRIDDNSNPVNFVQEESAKYVVVQSAEALVGNSVAPVAGANQLTLFDVVLTFGQTQVLTGDIDLSRRDDFVFAIVHGSGHTEFAPDPIPNATGAEGGLLSAVDKTKLDGVDFTDSGVGALFNNRVMPFQPANITAPAATTLDVSPQLTGKAAGGDSSKEGVVTQSQVPYNRCPIQTTGSDDFLDADGNKVFGRVTVNDENTPAVWTLSFVSINDAGTENAFDMTPYVGQTIQWWVPEAFSLENVPTFGAVAVPSDQVAGDVPDATTTNKGKVELAEHLEAVAGLVVQSDDPRLGTSPAKYYGEASGAITVNTHLRVRFADNSDTTPAPNQITMDANGSFTLPIAGRYRITLTMNWVNAGNAEYYLITPSGSTTTDLTSGPAADLLMKLRANGAGDGQNTLTIEHEFPAAPGDLTFDVAQLGSGVINGPYGLNDGPSSSILVERVG